MRTEEQIFSDAIRDGQLPGEMDQELNFIQREKIKDLKNKYGTAFIVNVHKGSNIFKTVKNPNDVKNFSGQYAVKKRDEKLDRLVRDFRQGPFNSEKHWGLLRQITDRVKELNGIHLYWV